MDLHNTIAGNILVVAAHPDDIEYGVAGTLLKFRDRIDPHFFIVTCGGENDPTSGSVRLAEAKAALKIFGNEILVSGTVGITYERYPYLVSEIEELIKIHKIDTVMTHSEHDTHQDHRMVTEIVKTACRRQRISLIFYTLLSSTDSFKPDIYVDITKEMSEKGRLLSMHKSQSNKYYMKGSYFDLFHSDRYARLHGMEFVERFAVGRIFL